ncbi:P-loop containing nucleoside triphosphate hydrolase protein [Amylostereum chailletii]|nr:P-loop containing nucleoside triphosphate hydrolase protein [Amylostereum chailletii]
MEPNEDGGDDSTRGDPLSESLVSQLDAISSTASENARAALRKVHSVTGGKITLREDQLLAAAYYNEGYDTVLVARTGSGKTMQIIIAALMNPKKVVLVLSPLKRLQDSMALEILESTGLAAVAINQDMRYNLDAWLGIEKGEYSVILTSPEQCGTINGHSTRLQTLLKDNTTFRCNVARLVVDEAHLIYLWGLPSSDKAAFREAWSRISDLHIKLPASTPVLLLSATAPPHMITAWEKTLHLRENYKVLRYTSNRSNQFYAIHPVHGDLKDFRNLRMLVPRNIEAAGSISLEQLIANLRKTLVFVDSMDLIRASAKGLYLLFPLWIRPALIRRNIIRTYYSGMSRYQLDKVFEEFKNGDCKILVATSAFSQGVNVPDIEIVIQYGLCQWVEELVQRFGRNARLPHIHGLSLLLAEPWAWTPSGKPGPKELRTSTAMKAYATSSTCLRAFFATHLGDASPDALSFDGDRCCANHAPEDPTVPCFDIQNDLALPGLFLTPGSDEKPPPQPRPRPLVRPSHEQSRLRPLIEGWLEDAVESGLIPSGYPTMFVLLDLEITALVRAPYVSVRAPDDLTQLLKKGEGWRDRYAKSLLAVIVEFQLEANVESTSWAAWDKDPEAKRKQDEQREEWDQRKRKRVQLPGNVALLV